MKLNLQKRLAASVLRSSPKRVHFDPAQLSEIKESITKADIKNLIRNDIITVKPKRGVSRGRARKMHLQKVAGKRSGQGSRKGSHHSRYTKKRAWINKVRIQRELLKALRDAQLINAKIYHDLYRKSKGGFFRSKGHIKLYIKEHSLISTQAPISK